MPHPKKIVHAGWKRENIILLYTLVVLHWLVHTATSCGEGGKEKGGKKRREGGERGGRDIINKKLYNVVLKLTTLACASNLSKQNREIIVTPIFWFDHLKIHPIWEGERDGKGRGREGERRTVKKVLILTTQACARFKLSQLQDPRCY